MTENTGDRPRGQYFDFKIVKVLLVYQYQWIIYSFSDLTHQWILSPVSQLLANPRSSLRIVAHADALSIPIYCTRRYRSDWSNTRRSPHPWIGSAIPLLVNRRWLNRWYAPLHTPNQRGPWPTWNRLPDLTCTWVLHGWFNPSCFISPTQANHRYRSPRLPDLYSQFCRVQLIISCLTLGSE